MKVYFSSFLCGLISALLVYSFWVLGSSAIKQKICLIFLCSEVLWFYDNVLRYLFQIYGEYSWQYFNLYQLNFSLKMFLYQVFSLSRYLLGSTIIPQLLAPIWLTTFLLSLLFLHKSVIPQ